MLIEVPLAGVWTAGVAVPNKAEDEMMAGVPVTLEGPKRVSKSPFSRRERSDASILSGRSSEK